MTSEKRIRSKHFTKFGNELTQLDAMSFIAEWAAGRFIALRAGMLSARGSRAMQRGDGAQAAAAYAEALEAKRSVNAPRSARVGMAMYDLASALRADNRPEEAAEVLTEVVDICECSPC